MKNRALIISRFLTIAMFISVVFFSITSCREKTETKTIVIEKEKEVEKPKAKEKEDDGTSLSIDGEGVEFSTKKGDNKTEISVED